MNSDYVDNRQFAFLLGVSDNTLRKWRAKENGDVPPPDKVEKVGGKSRKPSPFWLIETAEKYKKLVVQKRRDKLKGKSPSKARVEIKPAVLAWIAANDALNMVVRKQA